MLVKAAADCNTAVRPTVGTEDGPGTAIRAANDRILLFLIAESAETSQRAE
jgi:hypothetical protein